MPTTFPAADVAVVMVPFVAQGHLTQLYHLSHLLSTHNLTVHFISTTYCIHQLRSRHPISTLIHFHEFTVPPFTSPPPNPSTPYPTHLQPSFDSTLHLRHPTATLIRHLSQHVKKVVVIHDVLMSYVVQDVKHIPNAETYVFQPPPAFYISSRHWEMTGGSGTFPVEPELMKRLPSQDGITSAEFLKFAALQKPLMNHVGELYDSTRVIEGAFFEYLEKEKNKKIWAVGPLNPVRIASNVIGLKNRHKCLQWLDKQPANSVIYVSFGTTTTFSEEQVRELALGLERSGQRFVWVVRVADTGDSIGFEERKVELPEGFEERVRGRGLVERSWAPQLEILGHFATGGFMSHCGWNSSMESMSMGVPIVAWPMHSDQPRNAFLITDVLRIGIPVKNWERRNELVKANVVAEAVKTLMASEEGEEVRRRAVKLGVDVKESLAEGGVSRREMDSFISYIRS